MATIKRDCPVARGQDATLGGHSGRGLPAGTAGLAAANRSCEADASASARLVSVAKSIAIAEKQVRIG
jgi:hypothetical protein